MVITGNLKFKEILLEEDFVSLTIKFFLCRWRKISSSKDNMMMSEKC